MYRYDVRTKSIARQTKIQKKTEEKRKKEPHANKNAHLASLHKTDIIKVDDIAVRLSLHACRLTLSISLHLRVSPCGYEVQGNLAPATSSNSARVNIGGVGREINLEEDTAVGAGVDVRPPERSRVRGALFDIDELLKVK